MSMNLDYDVVSETPVWSPLVGTGDCYAAARFGATIIAVRHSNDEGIKVQMEPYLDGGQGRYGAGVQVFLGPDTPPKITQPATMTRLVSIVLNVLQRQPNMKVGLHAPTPSYIFPDDSNKVARDIVSRIRALRDGQMVGESVPKYHAGGSWN